MRRLILLSCSERKRSDADLLPAVQRYDGPAFRVLRRYIQEHPLQAPELYVLSAEYGLMSGDQPIPVYDRIMTRQRSLELRAAVASQWKTLMHTYQRQPIFVYASTVYQAAISPSDLSSGLQADLPRLTISTGTQGMRLTQLKSWLYEWSSPVVIQERTLSGSGIPIRFRLKGTVYEASRAQVRAAANRMAKSNGDDGRSMSAWYAQVDGQKVAPKRLISHLTGVPVCEFHSEAARRVLERLGFVVSHI